MPTPDCDYIIIGSGAGGGPLAANLAEKGYKVIIIEAGQNQEPDCYNVPVFHPFASEDPNLSWAFFVKHYDDQNKSKRDPKWEGDRGGIFYPRAGTLGGCTAHNAMITTYGHASDWQTIVDITGDQSYAPDKMRTYFERLEKCGYVKETPQNPSRHGYKGWLSTTGPDIELVFGDSALFKTVLTAVVGAWKEDVGDSTLPMLLPEDPNNWEKPKFEGVTFAPLATQNGRRVSTRDRILGVKNAYPDRLIIKGSNLATRILFDENMKAIGVETWEGQHLYKADPNAVQNPKAGTDYDVKQYYCAREVILAGGAFNSPQLLMLSGIGPKAHLEANGIKCLLDRPGVGQNLQDRYEVGVITQMQENWKTLANATFKPPLPNQTGDPCYVDWQSGKGVYATNGAALAIIKKSSAAQQDPDLFMFALPGYFRGYFTGYSEAVERTKDYLTWAILKAHTNNNAGQVKLKSNNPTDTPDVNFKYFTDGNDTSGEDLNAVVDGVNFVRKISKHNTALKQEIIPGPAVQTDDQIRQFVQDNAWGHHASCTNKMGVPTDSTAVVDSKFNVIGTKNLRIVDASIFPKIPGLFIVTPVYMISEKASDVVLADAK
jgi:choline dehydrogenase